LVLRWVWCGWLRRELEYVFMPVLVEGRLVLVTEAVGDGWLWMIHFLGGLIEGEVVLFVGRCCLAMEGACVVGWLMRRCGAVRSRRK
jgi:hypothetical protein